MIEHFYDLEVWKKGHSLVLQIYKVTANFPKTEQFGIISQIRRAASSITANIAEGFARYHFKDKIKFYYQARGSAAEVQNFLLLSKDLNFIESAICHELLNQIEETIKILNGLIRSTEQQVK